MMHSKTKRNEVVSMNIMELKNVGYAYENKRKVLKAINLSLGSVK